MPDEQEMQNGKKVPTKTTRMGIIGLILGIIAIICACLSFTLVFGILAIVIGVIALIFSVIGLVAACRRRRKGIVLTVIAIIISIVAIVLSIVLMAFVFTVAEEEAAKPTEVVDTSGNTQSGSDVDYSSLALGDTVKLDNGLSISVTDFDQVTVNNKEYTCVTVTYENSSDSDMNYNVLDWFGVGSSNNLIDPYIEGNSSEFDNYIVDGKISAGGTETGNVYYEEQPEKIRYNSDLVVEVADWVLSK